MKKKIILLTLLIATTLIAPVLAKGPTGKAGKSDIQLLYLVEKDPDDWSVVEDGAWGKMKYNLVSGDFVFNGHGLEAGTDYTLINFAREDEPWPADIKILGMGTANGGGNVHIADNYDYELLAIDQTPGSGDPTGYKIWLVPTVDITGDLLIEWNPGKYLFEADVIPLAP